MKINDYEASWIPQGNYSLFGYSVIGSHIWGMDHEGSDIDTFALVAHPSRSILRGEAPLLTRSVFRSGTDHDWPVDIHVHEALRVVDFLEKGNINFIVGIHSPLVLESTHHFESLRSIFERTPFKAVYHSARGMAESNWKRYKMDGSGGREVLEEHRARKLLRGLEFATRVCDSGRLVFGPPKGEPTIEGVEAALLTLDRAYDNSSLPERPGGQYRDWLEKLRLMHMDAPGKERVSA